MRNLLLNFLMVIPVFAQIMPLEQSVNKTTISPAKIDCSLPTETLLIDTDLTVYDCANDTVTIAGDTTQNGTLTVNGTADFNGLLTIDGQTTITAPFTFNGTSITMIGASGDFLSASSVTASAFFGDGFNLINLPGAARFAYYAINDRTGIICDDTNYEVQGRFMYPGSIDVGAPIAFDAVGAAESGKDFQVRIFDLTNATVIAESAVLTNTSPEVVSFGTISNIPAAEAVFEIQCQSPGGGKGFMDSVSVEYQ